MSVVLRTELIHDMDGTHSFGRIGRNVLKKPHLIFSELLSFGQLGSRKRKRFENLPVLHADRLPYPPDYSKWYFLHTGSLKVDVDLILWAD